MTRLVSNHSLLPEINAATSIRWLMYGSMAAPFRFWAACFSAANIAAAKIRCDSAVTSPATQAMPGSGVAITTRYGDELVITATGADDSVSLSETGSTFSIVADGATYSDAATAGGLFVYTRGGTDTITLPAQLPPRSPSKPSTAPRQPSPVQARQSSHGSTPPTASPAPEPCIVSPASPMVLSKATGAYLANPTDSGTTTKVTASLFGTGPVANDVNQGESGDCYFMASLAAFAGQNPQVLEQSVVDMGDGTYTVQFMQGSTPTFVRVSNALPSGPFNGLMFAHPAPMERSGPPCWKKPSATSAPAPTPTRRFPVAGWVRFTAILASAPRPSQRNFTVMRHSSTCCQPILAAGDEITFGTSDSPPNLVGDHAYTLVSCDRDSSGVAHYVVRNPWGVSGDSLENSLGYATLTFTQMENNFIDGCIS